MRLEKKLPHKSPIPQATSRPDKPEGSKKLNLALPPWIVTALETSAGNEKRRRSQFVRLLLEWALERYLAAGSLTNLGALGHGDLASLDREIEDFMRCDQLPDETPLQNPQRRTEPDEVEDWT